MSKISVWCATLGLLATAAILPAVSAEGAKDAIPNFNPDGETGWAADRPASDDFLPHDRSAGPGPVESDPAHPYTPNGQGQPTYRIADLTNPILQPWVVDQMRKTNEQVLAGKVPFIARERCWPAGVPGFDIYNRGQPVNFLQTPKVVLIVHELYSQVRHVYLNVPHSAHVTPSWYGESVGHYEGGELVVDTIGLSERTFVDNYRTPHTDKLHVVERFKLSADEKAIEVTVTVDDPGAFTAPWTAMQRFRRTEIGPWIEAACAEGNFNYYNFDRSTADGRQTGFLRTLLPPSPFRGGSDAAPDATFMAPRT
jgi:hypothetical protein